jgi:glycosyltransferase involved in cell wall biosynthesis
MTPIVSVVTAVHTPSMKYLPEAYESLMAQDMPAGWAWQRLVQEDGITGAAADHLPADSRISLGTGRPLGQGIARTYALSRVEGELVKVLDSDDMLTVGALEREVDVLERHPDIGRPPAACSTCSPTGQRRGLKATRRKAGSPEAP